MKIGYTQKQAERLKRQVNADWDKIASAAHAMTARVSDHTFYVDGCLEDLVQVKDALLDMIDRRTRTPTPLHQRPRR